MSGIPRTCKGMFSAYTQAPLDLGLPEETFRVLSKIIPGFCVDLQEPGGAFKDMKHMGLSGEKPLLGDKTKALWVKLITRGADCIKELLVRSGFRGAGKDVLEVTKRFVLITMKRVVPVTVSIEEICTRAQSANAAAEGATWAVCSDCRTRALGIVG